MTSPSFAMSTWARTSCASRSATTTCRSPSRPASSRSQEATSVLGGAERVKKWDRWLILGPRSRLARGLLPCALRRCDRLAKGDLHAHVVARDPARREVGPLTSDLDGERVSHLGSSALHRPLERHAPPGLRVAGRLVDPNDDRRRRGARLSGPSGGSPQGRTP